MGREIGRRARLILERIGYWLLVIGYWLLVIGCFQCLILFPPWGEVAQFPIPNSQFPIPNSQFPMPNAQWLDATAVEKFLNCFIF